MAWGHDEIFVFYVVLFELIKTQLYEFQASSGSIWLELSHQLSFLCHYLNALLLINITYSSGI